MMNTDLSKYDNSWYDPGPAWKRLLWYFVNILFLMNSLNPISSLKVWLLRLFGAKIGVGVVIKPEVNIKYPWKLSIGDHCWIGEKVWIDNLDQVIIENHVCVSQEAMLLCGNHDYKKASFDLITKKIHLKSGSWVGAKAVVCPGVTMHSHAILAVGSIASKDLEAFSIYRGNPATKIRERKIGGTGT